MQDKPTESSDADAAPAFDPDKASQLRTQTIETFRGHLRKVERTYCVILLAELLLAAWMAQRFFTSNHVREWILFGVLFLVFFVNTVLMHLWYWILRNRLGTWREIRLLRLSLALEHGDVETLDGLTKPQSLTRWQGLSRMESRAWTFAIVAAGMGFGIIGFWPVIKMGVVGSHMTTHRTVTLTADGTGRMETIHDLPNTRSWSMDEKIVYHGGRVSGPRIIPVEESSWRDGQGRRLGVRQEPAGPNVREVISLLTHVPPGRQFTLQHETETQATRSGDIWTFHADQFWGYDYEHFFDTVILPPGAEVISVEPQPVAEETQDARPVLRFEALRGTRRCKDRKDLRWRYEVKYRLPAPTTTAP